VKKTPKQRFRDFITREDLSEIPAVPIVAGDHAAHISGLTLKEVCKSGKKLANALVHSFRTYNHDLVVVFSDVTVEAEAMGVVLDFPEDNSPRIIKHPEIAEIQPKNPRKDGRIPEILYAAECCVNSIGEEVQVCVAVKDPFSLGVLLGEANTFFRDCIKNPQLNKEILEIALCNQIAFVHEIIKTGALPLIGAPFASGSLISPEMFAQFVTPYMERVIGIIRNSGLPVILHICGDTEIIVDRIMELHPDVVSIDELDIPVNAARFRDSVMFMGNLSTTMLLKGSPGEVFAATTELLNSVNDPFIPATGCDVPVKTPQENVKAMIRAIRTSEKKFRGMTQS